MNDFSDKKRKAKKLRLSHSQTIALGFFFIIAIGTVLLMLPVASREPGGASFSDAVFTATSASCVTGLVVQDTFSYWSAFGQCVILALIQVGGLGFMTISTFFFMLIRRRVGLRGREVLSESINTTQIGGILKLTKQIIWGTVAVEGTGAAILSVRFCRELGFGKGVYTAIFHSVSAFCNAGFDLCGRYAPFSSFTRYSDDILVNVVIMTLIIIGGVGFLVWSDFFTHGVHLNKYRLHSKVVLATTALLLTLGTAMLLITEYNASLRGMGSLEKLLVSAFGSVTARTAGFNTVDTATLSQAGKIITVLLMFIGGSPGSTAGGIKTTTFAVLMINTASFIRHRKNTGVFDRRLPDGTLIKASTVFFFNLSLALCATVMLCMMNNFDSLDIAFEAFSAIGTVGMTTGITRELSEASRYILVFLMFCGRVGSVSFATALVEKRSEPKVKNPAEQITIG